MDGGRIGEALALLRAGLDALAVADLTTLAPAAVIELMADMEAVRRRMDAAELPVLREADARWVAGDYGQTSTSELLRQTLRLSPREARTRTDRARDLGPNRAVTGEPLPPLYPHTAEAFAAGAISAEHTQVIRRALADIERIDDLEAGALDIAEKLLVEAAHADPPRLVAELGARLRDRLDPDGPEPREAEVERKRGLDLRPRPDGSYDVKGRLTGEVGTKWATILDPLSEPQPAAEGVPDDRTAGQRRHDAFGECADRLLRSGTLPSAGGAPVTVLVTIDWRDYLRAYGITPDLPQPAGVPPTGNRGPWLRPPWEPDSDAPPWQTGDPRAGHAADAAPGHALSGHGGVLSLRRLLLETCEAQVATIVTNDTGGVLAFGITRRRASPAQRLALAARDAGCSFPECTRPAAWCEAHHVVPWQLGGPTDLANLCLLCSFHHHQFEGRGWTVVMVDGHPEWIPPPWLDPAQRPRRNTAHHLPDFQLAREAETPPG